MATILAYETELGSGAVEFLVKLSQMWELDKEQMCVLLGYESRDADYVDKILSGIIPLRGRDAEDRFVHLYRIRSIFASLFRDVTVEKQWLQEPQSELEGNTSLELISKGSMTDLLRLRQFVEYMAGY